MRTLTQLFFLTLLAACTPKGPIFFDRDGNPFITDIQPNGHNNSYDVSITIYVRKNLEKIDFTPTLKNELAKVVAELCGADIDVSKLGTTTTQLITVTNFRLPRGRDEFPFSTQMSTEVTCL